MIPIDLVRKVAMGKIDVFLPQILKSVPNWDILLPFEGEITCEKVLENDCDGFMKWLVEEMVERSEDMPEDLVKSQCQEFLLELQTDISAMVNSSLKCLS